MCQVRNNPDKIIRACVCVFNKLSDVIAIMGLFCVCAEAYVLPQGVYIFVLADVKAAVKLMDWFQTGCLLFCHQVAEEHCL